MSEQDLEKLKEVERIIDKVEKPKTITVAVVDLQDMHKIKKHKDGRVTATPQYRILFSRLINSKQIIRVVDSRCITGTGIYELSVKEMGKKDVDSLYKNEEWHEMENMSPKIYEKVEVYDTSDVLAFLKDNSISFRDIVEYLIDDTGTKDRRLIDLVKSTIFPLPLEERETWQPFNNNAFVLTNTGAGKSTAYYRVQGVEPSSDVTYIGLLGGFSISNKGIRAGALNGSGVFPMDEFPEQRSAIMNQLLNYTEHGENIRSLVEPIKCEGTKSLVFMGNAEEGICDGRQFKEKVIGLATGKTLSRIGRRFAHVYYGNDFPYVKPVSTNYTTVKKARALVRNIIDSNMHVLMEFVEYCKEWILDGDEKYRELFDYLATLTEHEPLREFLLGHRGAVSKIKMAAVKLAVLDKLDAIKNGCEKDEVLEYAKKAYEDFKGYNAMSFAFLEESKKAEVFGLLEQGEKPEDIAKKVNVDLSTVYRWKKKTDFEEKKRIMGERRRELADIVVKEV